jgi:hypothetical protein
MARLNKNDLIISFANLVFIISLIPSILSPNKPDVLTSAMQVALSFIYIGVYANIKFRLAFIMNVIIMSMWLILAVQKLYF